MVEYVENRIHISEGINIDKINASKNVIFFIMGILKDIDLKNYII